VAPFHFALRKAANRLLRFAVDSSGAEMSAQIVSLNGADLATQQPAANETLVQELERLLQAARAGQIVGMAAAYQHQDRVITYSYAGAVGGYGVLGGLDCLKERLLRLTLSRG
jgi:hypothetical protein